MYTGNFIRHAIEKSLNMTMDFCNPNEVLKASGISVPKLLASDHIGGLDLGEPMIFESSPSSSGTATLLKSIPGGITYMMDINSET
jgi:hypothetical protein